MTAPSLSNRNSQDPEAFERDYIAATTRETAAPTEKAKGPAAAAVDDEFTTVGKGGKAMAFTADTILKNLQAVQEARGKKVRLADLSW